MPETQKATKLKKLTIKAVALCKEGSCSAAHIKLFKCREENEPMELKELLKSLPEDQAKLVTDAIAKAQEEVPEATATELQKTKEDLTEAQTKITELEKSNTPSKEEDLLKSVDPAVRALVEQAQASAKAAEAAVVKLRDEAETKVCTDLAKSLDKLGVPEADLTTVLRKARQSSEEFGTQMFSVLEQANAIVAKSAAFQATGTGAEGAPTTDNGKAATEKINAKAQELAKSKNISTERAFLEVMKSDPALYAEYLKSLQ